MNIATAAACPCSEFCGPVVAHGSSPYGVPWRVQAISRPAIGPQPPSGELHFSVGPCGETQGYFDGFPLPISSRIAFVANQGSEIDDYPESDLSGATTARVRSLVLRLSDGSILVSRPQLAPAALRHRWPWLRRLRVFNVFFDQGLDPVGLAVCDRRGHLLARQAASRYGSVEADLGAGGTASRACARVS